MATAAPVAAAEAIAKPELLHAAEAIYPAEAHGDAEVVFSRLISQAGRVTEVDGRSGAPPFVDAARAAVAAWTFAPAMRANVPVRARLLIRVSFVGPRAPEATPAPSPGEAQGGPRAPCP